MHPELACDGSEMGCIVASLTLKVCWLLDDNAVVQQRQGVIPLCTPTSTRSPIDPCMDHTQRQIVQCHCVGTTAVPFSQTPPPIYHNYLSSGGITCVSKYVLGSPALGDSSARPILCCAHPCSGLESKAISHIRSRSPRRHKQRRGVRVSSRQRSSRQLRQPLSGAPTVQSQAVCQQ